MVKYRDTIAMCRYLSCNIFLFCLWKNTDILYLDFQIFRALHVPLTSDMLSDILSRLVETVAEQGDDMQVNTTLVTECRVIVKIGT